MRAIAVAVLLLMQTARPEPPAGMPAGPGVYYRLNSGGWMSLKPAVVADMTAKGLELFVDTGGYTSLGAEGVFKGAKSAARIPERRPVFYVRGTVSPDDAMVIRLDQKQSSRNFETSSADATSGNKGGFKEKDISKTATVVFSDGSFSLAPERELKAGEYLLVFGYADRGFDFGIDAEKK